MSEIKLREPDIDLIPLLRECNNDELDNLVGYISKKGKVSSQLQTTRAYKKHNPDHIKYVDEIIAEIQKFGGNTIANIMRGGKGAYYKEIVCAAADKLKVNYNKKQDIDFIEQQILLKVLEKSWEKMSITEKKTLLQGIMADTKNITGYREFPMALLQSAIIAGGGYASYRLSLIVANAIAKTTLQRSISFASSAALSRWVAIFAGTVGWGITALWAIFDVSGPAYRVTVPCVLHIAMLRQLHILKNNINNGEETTFPVPDKTIKGGEVNV